jgi:hypothetical protein
MYKNSCEIRRNAYFHKILYILISDSKTFQALISAAVQLYGGETFQKISHIYEWWETEGILFIMLAYSIHTSIETQH